MNANVIFSAAEKEELLQKSNFSGFLALFTDLVIIAACCFLMVYYTNVLTIIFSIIVIGGRQLGLIVLMHECSHYSLFKSRWLNQFVGQWFGSAPFMNNLDRYRGYHIRHHKYTGNGGRGEKTDPDMSLLRFYPVGKKAFVKRIIKDLSGQSGIGNYYGLSMMLSGFWSYELGGKVIKLKLPGVNIMQKFGMFLKGIWRFFVSHGVLFSIFFFIGYWWLYLVWWGAAITTNMLFIRIRAMAEHCMLKGGTDLFKNTRTTLTGFLGRMTVAPHRVNYHLEHHLMMAVPAHSLKKMHKLLQAKGLLSESPVAKSYWQVIQAAYY